MKIKSLFGHDGAIDGEYRMETFQHSMSGVWISALYRRGMMYTFSHPDPMPHTETVNLMKAKMAHHYGWAA